MKSRITALVIGVVLGAAGTATGAGFYYWQESGRTYRCTGDSAGVICKETNWRAGQRYWVSIIPGNVLVSYGGRVIFGCDRPNSPRGNCTYFGP